MSPFSQHVVAGSRSIARLLCLAAILVAAAPARAQTPVVFGDVITEPGVYFLHGNQTGAGDGIRIQSDDVTLLLLRFTLRGDGTNLGISALNQDNITIYGGRVTRFQHSICLRDCSHCTVRDLRADNCSDDGVDLHSVTESWFLRLRCDHNPFNGIQAVNCYDCRFVSILAHDNDEDGIHIENQVSGSGESENRIRLCWAAYNDKNGIRIVDANDNDVTRNQCVGNGEAGIHLDVSRDDQPVGSSAAPAGTHDNSVTKNWCTFNADGIVAEWNATENTITENTALANSHHDMVDRNMAPPCANSWFLNVFLTKDGAGEDCIF